MKKIPKYGTPEWGLFQYEQAKIAKRGHNYEYWNEKKHYKMLENGWALYVFKKHKDDNKAISSEISAKEVVEKLRTENYFARIVCGYSQNVQRIKMFSVIYKKKK
jgi:hypothetical protein